MVACVASVSSRVLARKLEREQKKQNGRGRGRGEEEKLSSPYPYEESLSPLPSPSFPFFCSHPNVLDELARKRLLRRLYKWL